MRHTAVLLDQQPIWLGTIEGVLARTGVDVVAKATAPREALAALERLRPDLFVTEVLISDPELDGFAVVGESLKRVPTLKVIVVSASDNVQDVQRALDGGASAYVTKVAHAPDLLAAVRQTFSRSVYLAPDPLERRSGRTASRTSTLLTPREREILGLVAEGRSNAQVARMLWVTEETVKFHLSNIFRKAGVSNRTEATNWALANGIVERRAEGAARGAAEPPPSSSRAAAR